MRCLKPIPPPATCQRTSLPNNLFCLSLLLLAAISAPPLYAQEPPTPPPTSSAFVLRLDSRIAQVPTLFFSRDHRPLPPLDPQHINISLDGGKRFHPSHIRPEGDDPITLAILLDLSSTQSSLIPALSKSFSAWVTSSLKPQDHVSIYALDCAIFQTDNYQASSPEILQHDLDAAINSPLPHGKKGRPACGNSKRLRDSISTIMGQLSHLPGRRVLLVMTDGYDGGSLRSWDDLKNDAANCDVSVFSLTATNDWHPSPLSSFVQHTGGLSYRIAPDVLSKALPSFINQLRRRTILEFPLSTNFSGHHIIDVTLDHSDAITLPSGFAILPISDPTLPAGTPIPTQQ